MKCIEDEIPFELPEGWVWERMGNISTIARGGSPRPIKAYLTTEENGINWIKIGDTEKDGKYIFSTKEKIKPEGMKKSRYVQSGDFLLTNSMSFGRPYILKTDGCIHDGWLVIGNIESIFNQDYLYYALSANFMYQTLSVMASGSTVDNLNSDLVKALLFPIPPMNEQMRIAQKVEELLTSTEIINENEEVIINNIKKLKTKFLDLAIRGKLVPQNPDDEPASVLLERIRAEKEELINQGKIKRDKKESVIFKGEDNSYYDVIIPQSWEITNLSDVTLNISDGSHNPPPKKNKGVPLLSATNIYDNKINYTSATRWITEDEWIIENARTKIEVGDVLITIVGTIGRTAVVSDTTRFALQRSVAVMKPNMIDSKYLMYVLQAPMIIDWLNANAKGNAQVGIYLKDLAKLSFPLPPLAEQKRIVEAIETVFAQLDAILNSIS